MGNKPIERIIKSCEENSFTKHRGIYKLLQWSHNGVDSDNTCLLCLSAVRETKPYTH